MQEQSSKIIKGMDVKDDVDSSGSCLLISFPLNLIWCFEIEAILDTISRGNIKTLKMRLQEKRKKAAELRETIDKRTRELSFKLAIINFF